MLRLTNFELNNKRVNTLMRVFQDYPQKITINDFIKNWETVTNSEFNIITLDLDGTLRDIDDRRGPFDQCLIEQVCKLGMHEGIEIIIATGRRSSAIELGKLLVKNGLYQFNMILGNGLEIITYPSEEFIQLVEPFTDIEINEIIATLRSLNCIDKEKIIVNKGMIRIIYPNKSFDLESFLFIRNTVKAICPGAILTHSGYNIEILPNNAKKNAALNYLVEKTKKGKIIALGDSCHRFGNDFDILSKNNSFCVSPTSYQNLEWTLPVINEYGKILFGFEATKYVLDHLKLKR